MPPGEFAAPIAVAELSTFVRRGEQRRHTNAYRSDQLRRAYLNSVRWLWRVQRLTFFRDCRTERSPSVLNKTESLRTRGVGSLFRQRKFSDEGAQPLTKWTRNR
jgi:hypothetical protein